ncbi:MAG TPA: AMP-binding protein [Baekduia sp.]|nr:AMP-binding protein [Baekduia sp.]
MDQKAVRRLVDRGVAEGRSLVAVRRAGMLGGASPRDLARMLTALQRNGPISAGATIAALKHGPRTALVDDLGTLTFAEMDARATRLAAVLRDRGICDGATLGVLCRNHRYALEAIFAGARAGARVVFLNTSFAAPQVRDVAAREGLRLLIVDEDLLGLTAEVDAPKVLAWGEGPHERVEDLVARSSATSVPAPAKRGGIVLLTSGTTGTPKGAQRAEPRGLLVPGMLLDRIPLRSEQTALMCAPLFHATGFAMTILLIGLGTTVVLHRRFDPEETLEDLERHRAEAVVLVPVMLQRLLAVGADAVRAKDTSALRVVFCAGSQLPGELSDRAMDLLGDVVYNLYGSTEVSVATIATPQDLREAPGCTGRPVLGTTVRLLDDAGREVPAGQTGRIFVGGFTSFDGYTGGGGKEVVGGLMSTGDVGHFDAQGRLFIDGRDDEMIVSGGENVFPREVEELLVHHEAIADAAAIGVPDEDFGQRLRAFVVLEPGAEMTEDDVRDYVKENLARFKVPRDVVFVDELPRNPSGKILKKELAER